MQKITYVTRPALPALDELIPSLEKIWASGILTNNGSFHRTFEDELAKFLGVKFVSLFTNATIALLTSIKYLNLSPNDEIITTPFSFIATSHAILWNNIKPVFVDINPLNYNINPKKIEESITSKTKAILAVHCFGIPADVKAIEKIAAQYNLKVIYDAAHAFGVDCHCGSLLNHGDMSILSFHATKVFNTFEGGAIITNDENVKISLEELKNFGHNGETSVINTGINGKMSEFNAALGLLQLKHVDEYITKRKIIFEVYQSGLKSVNGINVVSIDNIQKYNFSYMPISVTNKFPISRDELHEALKTIGIYSRRYFYPLITDFSMYQIYQSLKKNDLKNAKSASEQVLCLPIYPDLELSVVDEIISFISSMK